MSEALYQKLHLELSETQARRHKLDVLKISFVTTLLGFGGIKLQDSVAFFQLLYLVPLVSVLFDLLVMGQHYSIRRIGAFLRLSSQDQIERDFEVFVSRRRDSFFKWGSQGFTILSYLASGALLWVTKGSLTSFEWSWFLFLFVTFIAVTIKAQGILAELDDMDAHALEELLSDRGDDGA